MQNKLQELTEKLYNEGLSKGKQDAEELKANAKAQAAEIVKRANEEAAQILKNAAQAVDKHQQTRDEQALAQFLDCPDVFKGFEKSHDWLYFLD